ncbi:MAG: DUF2516 family protein [bacterium]
MRLVDDIESAIYMVLFWSLLVVRVWALADSLVRKSAAFPAAGKLTKPAWVALTAFSLVISALLQSPLSLISLALLVVSLVYLADVRPAVREVSGGSRW